MEGLKHVLVTKNTLATDDCALYTSAFSHQITISLNGALNGPT